MKIVCSPLYESQIKVVLEEMAHENLKSAIDFKLYLDTVLMNAHTKFKKYKQSIYFEKETVKDVEFEGYTIPIFYDEVLDKYIILGVVKK